MKAYYAEQEPGWCAWCGEALPEIRHWRTTFCDKTCSNAYFNSLTADARADVRATLACRGCGKTIRDAKRQDRQFCDAACRRRTAQQSAFTCDRAA
ncbi:hypothetical protein [Aquamicrobium sp.]|uniref:hypothetical protein n=1 Tax=Aquamicrobium sp. TaxID=1872579 RepID=UPI00258FADD4|nr:hypothetical protein [Aquamicrobium sp.]MCK9551236.1 hypothetical protein [Aquamicrobium sp.]